MNITIVPQTPEQFDRLMAFLEAREAKKQALQAEAQMLIKQAAVELVGYLQTLDLERH